MTFVNFSDKKDEGVSEQQTQIIGGMWHALSWARDMIVYIRWHRIAYRELCHNAFLHLYIEFGMYPFASMFY